jgi:hypothetical protein
MVAVPRNISHGLPAMPHHARQPKQSRTDAALTDVETASVNAPAHTAPKETRFIETSPSVS